MTTPPWWNENMVYYTIIIIIIIKKVGNARLEESNLHHFSPNLKTSPQQYQSIEREKRKGKGKRVNRKGKTRNDKKEANS